VVRDAATGAGLVAVTIRLFGTFQNQFSYISEATTDASGSYAVEGLTAGTYYATTYLAEGYVDEAFGDVWCLGQCSSQIARSGAPIVVGAGTETQGRDFLLARGGSIDGTITGVLSPGSATPVVGASVYVYSVVGDQLAGGWGGMTDAAGRYRITGLPGGTYYLQVQPPTENGLLGQFYGGSPCGDACDLRLPINGVPIQVATGVPTTGREVQVARGGSISGVVTNAATLLPVPNAFVNASALVGGQPRTFGYGYTDAAGAFSISALPPGTYSLWTDNRVGLIDQVYPDVACPGTCTPLLSQHLTVPVAQYATTTGRNFALDPGGSIMGLTTDGRTGAPTLSAYVNVYTRAAGEVVTVAQARPDASGIYTVPNLSVGTYWAMGFVFDRLRAQVFENIPCPDLACAPDFVATGTPIVVEPPTPYTGVNFNFQPDSLPPRAPTSLSAIASSFRVRLSWTPNGLGSEPTGYIVEAGFASGTTAVTLPTTAPILEVSGVPPGRYFVRVRARNAFGVGPASGEFVVVVNGDGAGSPNAVQNFIAWMSGRRLNVTWSDALVGERPTDYVVEVGSSTGLANIAVLPASLRSFSYEPVPDGFYFVRVRARLGANVGPPTRERMVKAGNGPSPPEPPLGLTIAVNGNVVTLSWTPPLSGPPLGYRIEAGTALGLSNVAVFDTRSAATSFAAAGVPPGTYYVRLRAINAIGVGPATFDGLVVVR
jgi:hypothetical protein